MNADVSLDFGLTLHQRRLMGDDVVSEAHHGTIYRSQASTRMLEARKSEIFCDLEGPTLDVFTDAWLCTLSY